MVITYAGKEFAALRPDQQAYVQQCMVSWRAHGPMGMYLDRILRRAIRKARQNLP